MVCLVDRPALQKVIAAMRSDNLAGVSVSAMEKADNLQFPSEWEDRINDANDVASKLTDEDIDTIMGDQDESQELLRNKFGYEMAKIFEEVLAEIFEGELNNHFFVA